MRSTLALLLGLVIVLLPWAGARTALAKEEDASRAARRSMQEIWYAGQPKAIAAALGGELAGTVTSDAESLLRLMMYANDALPRGDFSKSNASAWKSVVQALEAAAHGLEDRPGARYRWAREETNLLLARIKNRLGMLEDPWKATSDATREISRTEGSGLWTSHGYTRAFELHAQQLEAKNGNFFSSAGGFIYLRAKMDHIRGALGDSALDVGAAHQPFVEAFMSLKGEKPDIAKGRPKLEEALEKIAYYLSGDKVPAGAVRLHNDLVELVERVPDLEMEVAYDARELSQFRKSLLPQIPTVEQALTVAVPYSRLWRVLEGRLGDADALHLLRTKPDGDLAYEITIAALDPKAKCVLPGSKSKLKGSAHKSIAGILAKNAKKRLGSGAKLTGPTKDAFAGKLKGAWVYTVVGKERFVRGAVGKGYERSYVVELTGVGTLDAKLPGDVQLLLDRLAVEK